MSTATTRLIEPRLLKGFRDFLPPQMIQRQRIIEAVRNVYECFGYLPLDTPVLEYEDILTGKYGEEADSLMYRFTDRGGRRVAMRYDLTVPLARVVAMYQDLPRPFKRYHIGPVWRGESPQKGRYREFVQFDADICGSSSMLADAEIVALIYTVMRALGIARFAIEINNRKVLNGLVEFAGLAVEDGRRVFQALDKLPKVGRIAVRQELLTERTTYEDQTIGGVLQNVPIVHPPFPAEAVDRIMAFTEITGSNQEILAGLEKMFTNIPVGLEGVRELTEVLAALEPMGIDERQVRVKTSIARGLDYYTGTVFETTLLERPEFGSVFSGGRFDELIGLFTGKNVPAVGASVGVDRLFAAMEELGILQEATSTSEVLVTVFPGNSQESLRIARELRVADVKTEVFLGDLKATNPLRAQLRYANTQKIPVVVIAFPEKPGLATIRTMASGEQTEVSLDDLAPVVKQALRKEGYEDGSRKCHF